MAIKTWIQIGSATALVLTPVVAVAAFFLAGTALFVAVRVFGVRLTPNTAFPTVLMVFVVTPIIAAIATLSFSGLLFYLSGKVSEDAEDKSLSTVKKHHA